jgi:hypothetical protein
LLSTIQKLPRKRASRKRGTDVGLVFSKFHVSCEGNLFAVVLCKKLFAVVLCKKLGMDVPQDTSWDPSRK